MRRLLAILLAASMILMLTPSVAAAAGNVYYVSPSGNDLNPGTQSKPWKTITKAAASASAGDVVIIGAGTYEESVHFTRSGSPTAMITFMGRTAPVIVKASITSQPQCLNAGNTCVRGVLTIDGDFIALRNLEVAGPWSDPGDVAGITSKGSYNQITSNYVHNSYKEGISVRETSINTHVIGNTISYAVVSGIWFDGLDHLIQGNTITHTVTRAPNGTIPASGTDPDGIRFFGTQSMVKGNVIKDIYVDESPAGDAPHSDCFQTWRDVNDITFDGNYCELENTTMSTPLEKFFMIGRSAGTTVTGIQIINNIFVSKSTSQLWTPLQVGDNACSSAYPLTDITIDNNTFVHTGNIVANTAILLQCSSDVDIHNNAFYNFGDDSHSYILQNMNNNVNVEISNNAVYNSTGEIPKGGPYPGDNIAGVWMHNPMFVNVGGGNYYLQAGSPLIDSGIDLADLFDHDYIDNPRPEGQGYDIGAYELIAPSTISGNAGDAGVTLTYYDNGTKTVTADSNGDYSFSVPYQWSGTVAPSKVYYTFNPANRKYANVTTDQVYQDFTYSVSSFADVPTTYWAWPQIEALYAAGLTSGCGTNPRVFCPNRNITRAEMAVLILRARDGSATPVPAETNIFTDVPVPGKEWMQPWIEQFYLDHITFGCSKTPVSFCPERQTTRAEMAVFILKAIHPEGYQPPAAQGFFDDLPVAGKEWMQPWVEELYREGITTGCNASSTLFCPENLVTRAEMAVFLSRAFNY